MKGLLSKMLVEDPAKRASMDDLYTDPWLCFQQTEPMLKLTPKRTVETIPVDSKDEDEQIAQMIGTISFKEGCIIYNLAAESQCASGGSIGSASTAKPHESADSISPLPSVMSIKVRQ